MIIARKMPEFYIIIARKNIFSRILVARTLPVPVSYAYDSLVYSLVCLLVCLIVRIRAPAALPGGLRCLCLAKMAPYDHFF